jgi:hypothetical protein
MAGDLHEYVVATGIPHLGQKSVDRKSVGGGMRSGLYFTSDPYFYGRQQAGFIAEAGVEIVKEGGYGGFSVRASYAY